MASYGDTPEEKDPRVNTHGEHAISTSVGNIRDIESLSGLWSIRPTPPE
jgi:hypothetical protein